MAESSRRKRRSWACRRSRYSSSSNTSKTSGITKKRNWKTWSSIWLSHKTITWVKRHWSKMSLSKKLHAEVLRTRTVLDSKGREWRLTNRRKSRFCGTSLMMVVLISRIHSTRTSSTTASTTYFLRKPMRLRSRPIRCTWSRGPIAFWGGSWARRSRIVWLNLRGFLLMIRAT